jgi:hypothetical protein
VDEPRCPPPIGRGFCLGHSRLPGGQTVLRGRKETAGQGRPSRVLPATSTARATAGPLNQVRQACAADRDCRSVADIVVRTGLPRDVVDACLEHLLRTGWLRADTLASGCPDDACGSCAVRHGCPIQRPNRARGLTPAAGISGTSLPGEGCAPRPCLARPPTDPERSWAAPSGCQAAAIPEPPTRSMVG